jgi:hypothetical protein
MGILDDAIREHLDLKRKHGAHDADLREIEDEAFGSTDRPDPFAANELFNEVSATGTAQAEPAEAPPEMPGGLDEEASSGLGEPDVGDEEPTRLVEPEALRPPEPSIEAPEPSTETREPEFPPEPISPPEDLGQIPGQVELPEEEIPGQERLDDPLEGLEGYEPAEPEPAEPELAQPDPPSQSESLEDLIAEEEPFPEDVAAPPVLPHEDTSEHEETSEPELPRDSGAPLAPPEPERLESPLTPESEESESPLTPEPEDAHPDPPPPPPDAGPEPPGRARGRVDVPTQEHPPPGQTGGLPPVPPPEPEHLEPMEDAAPLDEPEPFPDEKPANESGGPALYDFETDEEPQDAPPPSAAPPDDDFEALGPAEEEAPYLDEEEPYADEPTSGTHPVVEEPGTEVRPALEDEEVYEGESLDPEETYEEEEDEGEEGLWFEKGPPKDFDFDD